MDSSFCGHHSTQFTASSSNFNDSDVQYVTKDGAGRSSIQLIDKHGYFKELELRKLIREMKLAEYGGSYMVVAIIGPQISGKSTLLNHLFGTDFAEMKAERGRSQTTTGIWLGYNDAIKPCTLVMDIEGSDGQERGRWCKDIGREKTSNKLLFKIIFEVTRKLYKPRKITLIFVIRDVDETPAEILKQQLINIIHEIWNSIQVSGSGRRADFSRFFNLEVVALSHYVHLKNEFINQVSKLKDCICDANASHSRERHEREIVPASVLLQSFQEIWKGIRANKGINIRPHVKGRALKKDRAGRSSIQLIDELGDFKESELEKLIGEMKLAEYGVSYMVVAIIGPQSSGKSTLLNHLFGTDFAEMKAERGRSQTTNGIWIGYNDAIKPCTLVMDIEGSDGQERGENDTKFERQTALFALAVADVVFINIWCKDIGREKAFNKLLFKIVFEVTGKLYKPRKITLIFVIRDIDETPAEILKQQLISIIHEIWNSIQVPGSGRRADFSRFFNLEVVALSHYVHLKNEFINQVSKLKASICNANASHSRERHEGDVVPASVLPQSLRDIWKGIRENKEIDIPSHEFCLATSKCDGILREKLISFLASETSRELKNTLEHKSEDALGSLLTSMIDDCLLAYDGAATHFDKNVKSVKRKELEEQLLQYAREDYTSSMGHSRSKIWREFKEALGIDIKNDVEGFAATARKLSEGALREFDRIAADATPKQATWNSSAIRNQLKNDIDDHIVGLLNSKIPEILNEHKEKMKKALAGDVKSLLLGGRDDPWQEIRKLLERQSQIIVREYRDALSRLNVSKHMVELNVSLLKNHGIEVVVETAREESESVLKHIGDRFMSIVLESHDLGVFTKQKELDKLARRGRTESLKLLSTLAVIRLDKNCFDSVYETLYRTLNESSSAEELHSKSSWDGVKAASILLTPRKCLEIWEAFIQKTSFSIREKLSWGKIFKGIAVILSIVLAPLGPFAAIGPLVGIVSQVLAPLLEK